MWFKRDLLDSWTKQRTLSSRILVGVRQCGKSSFLRAVAPPDARILELDDLQTREMARRDPALLLESRAPITIIDEAQYAPALFPEIKKRIDRFRAERAADSAHLERREPVFWLSGSNRTLLDREVKESLAGRVSYWSLHPLSVRELVRAFPALNLSEIFLRGGWPELYLDRTLSPLRFLNDYIVSFVEKDIVLSAGIQKTAAFQAFLGLLAARTAQMANFSEMGAQCGSETTTVQDWFGVLERNQIAMRLPPFATNLSKRLVKSPKLYILDAGLAARLQGWSEAEPLIRSPAIGALFETLVLGELARARDHLGLDSRLSYWRTRDGEEIDFIVEGPNQKRVALEAKFAVQNVAAFRLSNDFTKSVGPLAAAAVVTFGGARRQLSAWCEQIPIAELGEFLVEIFG
ncbi:MAG: ATP-binding protein [Deltaproteobacteria bacterium]|nr:ATP-binding protein [Deltaproteobacteria bacterium]